MEKHIVLTVKGKRAKGKRANREGPNRETISADRDKYVNQEQRPYKGCMDRCSMLLIYFVVHWW